MGKFFREFNDAPQSSSSMTVMLFGIAMIGGTAWMLHWVWNGAAMASVGPLLSLIGEHIGALFARISQLFAQ